MPDNNAVSSGFLFCTWLVLEVRERAASKPTVSWVHGCGVEMRLTPSILAHSSPAFTGSKRVESHHIVAAQAEWPLVHY